MGKNKYNRHSIRLKEFDYSLSGYYFITICTEDSEKLFGKIINNEMVLNDFGKIVHKEWYELKERFNIELHEFIVMPDHIHGIIEIINDNGMEKNNKGVINYAPTSSSRENSDNYYSKISPKSNSLSIIIRSYKSCVTRNIRRNYIRRGVIYNALITNPHNAQINRNNNVQTTDPSNAHTNPKHNTQIKISSTTQIGSNNTQQNPKRHDELQNMPSTKQKNKITIWQRNYFERIIRNEKELNNIRQYIIDNQKKWDE